MGLVLRAPSPTSRREVELRLSMRGRALLEEYRALRAAELNAVLERMAPADLAALTDGLAAFHAAASERLSPERGTDASPLRDDVADSA